MNEEQTTVRPMTMVSVGETGHPEWDASASEARLRKAFDRGGFEAWAECASLEMEAERRLTARLAARERT